MGLFASPNTSAIMSAVPPRFRGVASGMRATFMNAGQMLSMGIFFSMVISSLANGLPGTITRGLSKFSLPAPAIQQLAHLPPMSVLFAALLGYNPLKMLLGGTPQGRLLLHHMPAHQVATLTSPHYFPTLISHPFMDALRVVFVFAAAMTFLSAILSVFRGERFIYEEGQFTAETSAPATGPKPLPVGSVLLALSAVWMAKDGVERDAPVEREEQLRRSLTLLALTLGHNPPEPAANLEPDLTRIAETYDRPVASETVP